MSALEGWMGSKLCELLVNNLLCCSVQAKHFHAVVPLPLMVGKWLQRRVHLPWQQQLLSLLCPCSQWSCELHFFLRLLSQPVKEVFRSCQCCCGWKGDRMCSFSLRRLERCLGAFSVPQMLVTALLPVVVSALTVPLCASRLFSRKPASTRWVSLRIR